MTTTRILVGTILILVSFSMPRSPHLVCPAVPKFNRQLVMTLLTVMSTLSFHSTRAIHEISRGSICDVLFRNQIYLFWAKHCRWETVDRTMKQKLADSPLHQGRLHTLESLSFVEKLTQRNLEANKVLTSFSILNSFHVDKTMLLWHTTTDLAKVIAGLSDLV